MAIDNPSSTTITPPSKIRARWVHIYFPSNGYVPGDVPLEGEELPRVIMDLVGCEPEMDGESQAENEAGRLKWTDSLDWPGSTQVDEKTDAGLMASYAATLATVAGNVDTMLGAVDSQRVALKRIEE